MVTATTRLTIEEFEQLPPSEERWELVNGELVELNAASTQHGEIAGIIAGYLFTHVHPRKLGRLYIADAGFVVSHDPPTVRVPDVSFVRQARRADLGDPTRFGQAVPDLVVEIVSPSDTWRDVWVNAAMWLTAGVEMVWLVDPVSQKVFALTPDAPLRTFTGADQLNGGALLPEFRMPLAEIFAF